MSQHGGIGVVTVVHGTSGGVSEIFRHWLPLTLRLRVADHGCGFPDELDFRATESLGLQLVCTLTEPRQGTIALERAKDPHVTMTVPLGTSRVRHDD
jgi:two-component sensor histidine kinase